MYIIKILLYYHIQVFFILFSCFPSYTLCFRLKHHRLQHISELKLFVTVLKVPWTNGAVQHTFCQGILFVCGEFSASAEIALELMGFASSVSAHNPQPFYFLLHQTSCDPHPCVLFGGVTLKCTPDISSVVPENWIMCLCIQSSLKTLLPGLISFLQIMTTVDVFSYSSTL